MSERSKLNIFIEKNAWFLPAIWKRQTKNLIGWEKTTDEDRKELMKRLLCVERCLALLPRESSERLIQLCANLDTDADFTEIAGRLELRDIAPDNVATWLEQMAPSFQPIHAASDEKRIVSTIICGVVLPLDGKQHGSTERFVYQLFQPLCLLFALHSAGAYVAAAFLGESIAGLQERDYADPSGLTTKLHALEAKHDHVFHVANLIYIVAYSVQRLPTRGRRQAVSLLESWMGIGEEDYLRDASLQETLASGPLGQVKPTLQVILIELLASSLNGISDSKSFDRASILMESWLGIRKADYQTTDQMTRALKESPLAAIPHQPVWEKTLTTFSTSLSQWRLRGRRCSFVVLEAWLRNWIKIPANRFDTPGELASRGCKAMP